VTTQSALTDRILATLALPDGATAPDQVAALAADWRREAGDDDDSDAIIDMLLEDLGTAAQAIPASERLGLLHAQVTERAARRLSVQSFDLAKRRLSPEGAAADLSAQADALVQAHGALLQTLRSSVPADRRPPIERELQEVFLEATFVKAGGAMSPRLARWASDHGIVVEGPPDLP
jgi:hypothetical protein